MIERYGKLVDKNESDAVKNDSNMFPPMVLFNYQKKFEPATVAEGFDKVTKLEFTREFGEDYVNKALILDYDGTLRECVGGNGMYPTKANEIKILENRAEVLKKYKDDGYILLGVSNQSGIAKGALSKKVADMLFKKTNEMLGVDIDYVFCSHASGPASCYCRKPMPGHGVHFIEKYKLDPSKCIMVGDMTSDKTFAKRCGFQFKHSDQFFN